MKLPQLSLFLENKPGHLGAICRTLADAGVNIETLSLADTAQFGILRLIVEDWKTAREALEKAGFVVNVTEVVATEVPDRPGGLADLLAALEPAAVNIEYMYAFTFRRGDKATIVFRFDDPDTALGALETAGCHVLTDVEVFRRAPAE